MTYQVGPYTFKDADSPDEFEQVHRLNHHTFVREIPQHTDPGGERLVDKFHAKNRYLVAVRDGRVVGMVSAHDRPPFSVADRLPDPAVLTAPGVRPVEIRLLAVATEERASPVLSGLVWALYQDATARGYTHFVISGVEEQQPLYAHLGFVPLGPAVGDGRAKFVPMWLPVDRVQDTMGRAMQLWKRRLERSATVMTAPASQPPQAAPVCLLPGPVAVSAAVAAALREPVEYHRTGEFRAVYEGVRARLGDVVGGKRAAVFVGSGTLANDAVAATLAASPVADRGLVLVTGEFGERLARQATRAGLRPRVLAWEWGRTWDLTQVDEALKECGGGWVWGVHHETSSGAQNDLPGLLAVARRHDVRVALDCVSSLGTVPLDLAGVYLASAASGKAVGAVAGLSAVFADPARLAAVKADRVPTYLDVPAALACDGPRWTVPSPLVRALDAALARFATPTARAERYAEVTDVGGHVRRRLTAAGIVPLAADAVANPSLVTFAPPRGFTAAEFVARCREWGYLIGGQSAYLADRGLVQVAVMGAVTRADVDPLLDRIAGV